MNADFSVILEEFEAELGALNKLIELGQASSNSPKVRVASINSVTLILAAMFEEFVRQMARQFVMQIVSKANALEDLPPALLETAWRRTLDDLRRNRVSRNSKNEELAATVHAARPKFEAVCRFLEGDTKQNIYDNLIHNEGNMRAPVINRLFKDCGTRNICMALCENESLRSYFNENDKGKVNGKLVSKLDEFFERRNNTAHSLNVQSSPGSETLNQDICFFHAFAQDLSACLGRNLGVAGATGIVTV